ncbi:hypothetical protein AB0B57_35940 [Micromonospora sp. NPDC049101]|uniref:hypothetical protein n=1 Tax=Micromonospora sp. NPDC049101 TaxID=3155032 RepID=UPI0033C3F977
MAVILDLGGTPFVFFPAGEPLVISGEVVNSDQLEDLSLIYHPRLRRILLRSYPSMPALPYVLHWSAGTDLHYVDRRVIAGTVDANDFQGALVAEVRSVTCRKCGAILRVAVAETGVSVLGGDLAPRIARHEFRRNCSVCGQRSLPSVVEHLDAA